jgi:putative endonuclease
MFYTYVLKSDKNEELYIGYTQNLKTRLKEHNQELNLSTKRYAPWALIYYEACLNEKDARRREKYLKTTQGARLLRRRLGGFLYKKI